MDWIIWSSLSRAGAYATLLTSLTNLWSINDTILCVSESFGIRISGSSYMDKSSASSDPESYSGISRIGGICSSLRARSSQLVLLYFFSFFRLLRSARSASSSVATAASASLRFFLRTLSLRLPICAERLARHTRACATSQRPRWSEIELCGCAREIVCSEGVWSAGEAVQLLRPPACRLCSPGRL